MVFRATNKIQIISRKIAIPVTSRVRQDRRTITSEVNVTGKMTPAYKC